MSALAALQAAGLSSSSLAPPPLTLQVAGSLNLDRARKQGGEKGSIGAGFLVADVGGASGGPDTSKRVEQEEIEQLAKGPVGGAGADQQGRPQQQQQQLQKQQQEPVAGGAVGQPGGRDVEIWPMPSLELGIAMLPADQQQAAVHAAAAAGAPTAAKQGQGVAAARDEQQQQEAEDEVVFSPGSSPVRVAAGQSVHGSRVSSSRQQQQQGG